MLFGLNNFLFMGVTVLGVIQNSLMSWGVRKNVSNKDNCLSPPLTLQMKGPL